MAFLYQMTRIKKYSLLLSITLLLNNLVCAQHIGKKLTQYVDPFIGTLGEGNVFAGACLPHGFVKLGPDTKFNSGASGYKRNLAINGFSHLHITGMGGPLYGNIQLIPVTGKVNGLSHSALPSKEKAAPGYYAVTLNKFKTDVELTATQHVGFHRYTFPQTDSAHVLIDVGATLYGVGIDWSSSVPVEGEVHIDPKTNAVYGYGVYKGSRSTRSPWKVYFYAMFDTPFKGYDTWNDSVKTVQNKDVKGKRIGAILNFKTKAAQRIAIKVGISMISSADAQLNISQEIPDWDFENIRSKASALWEKELHKIEVKGLTDQEATIFYTALYHGLLVPSDWTGQNPKLNKKETYYEDFLCLWDIYRTMGPLLTLISTKEYADMLNTLLGIYDRDGWLPDAHSALQREFIQVGTSADMMFADAYLKGVKGVDYKKAYQAIKKNGIDTSFVNYPVLYGGRRALPDYERNHFVSVDTVSHYRSLDTDRFSRKCSVSKSLEYSYGDFAIYEMAQGLGLTADAKLFKERSFWYKNLWDDHVKKMRGRYKDGSWITRFTPEKYQNNLNYYEGNGYTWSYFVPHDVTGLINLFGGRKAFVDSLSDAIDKHYEAFNEPGMLQIYLFNWAGRPDLTQKYIRQILTGSFSATDAGLPGNDDSGTTSLWYLWSRLGIYPVAGQNLYVFGSPSYPETVIHQQSGKDLRIIAKNVSSKNIFIQSAKLNGVAYRKSYLRHEDLKNGAILEFTMGPAPSAWASDSTPPALSN